jgi:hypothetical protein
MNALRFVYITILIGVVVARSPASFQPSFTLDWCAWKATHVVVVTELNRSRGDVKVVESWKGSLTKGKHISIPELASLKLADLRIVKNSLLSRWESNVRHPAQVTGARMVLFLIGNSEERPDRQSWQLANTLWKGEIKASVAWIEGGKVYAFEQETNPGPSELHFEHMTEAEMKDRVTRIVQMRGALDKALVKPDSSDLSKALLPILRFDSPFLGDAAVDKLGAYGKQALPSLRIVLKDKSLLKYHPTALKSMMRASGKAIGAELISMADEDFLFWQTAARRLKPDWCEGGKDTPAEETNLLQEHYNRTLAILQSLEEAPAGSHDVVTRLRDLWSSRPALASHREITEECESILKALRSR